MTTRDNGIYYFLGNVTSHVLHALPLYRELGGTFVTTSKAAKKILDEYDIPTICVDDIPYVWKWQGKRPHRIKEYTVLDNRFLKTAEFLNSHAKVVIFYELFEFADDMKITQPKKIFLTHGNMLKNYFKMYPRRLETIKQYDYMAALGPYMKQEFIRSGIEENKLVDIGIARTDEVSALAGKRIINDRLVNLGVPLNKPVISYLPTFWGDSSIEKLGPQMLENISNDFTVLFRPHPQTPNKILKRYEKVISRSNIFYLPERGDSSPSLLDIYAASSLIVGDESSVMLEAILLDKPIIFATPDVVSNVDPHDQLHEIRGYSERVSRENVGRINLLIATSIKKGIDKAVWNKSKATTFFNYDGTSVNAISRFIRSIV